MTHPSFPAFVEVNSGVEHRFQSKFVPPGKPKIPPLIETVLNPFIEVLPQPETEGQVIVHIHFLAFPGALIRVWASTFLYPSEDSESKIPLVHAENISMAPIWTHLTSYGVFSFTLLFKSLPGDCLVFDLAEEIEETGAFCFKDISRNQSDVYHLWI